MTDQAPVQSMSMADRIAAQFADAIDPTGSAAPPQPEQPARDEDPEAGLDVAAEGADDGAGSENDEQQRSSEETVEIEFDGKALLVPKWAEKAFLQQRDFTQKTQEVARERERLALERSTIERQQKEMEFFRSFEPQYRTLSTLAEEIRQMEEVDLRTLTAEEAIYHQADQQKKIRQYMNLQSELQHKQTTFQTEREEALKTLRAQVRETLRRENQRITEPELDAALKHLQSAGYSEAEAATIATEARASLLAWKAYRYDQLLANKAQAVQKVVQSGSKPGPSSRPMPTEVKERLNYRKDISRAKTPQEKTRAIAKRLESMF